MSFISRERMGLFGEKPEGSSTLNLSDYSTGDSYSGSKLRSYGGGEADSFSSGLDVGGAGGGGDIQAQVAMEQQKLQLMSQVHKLNETCWDLCVGYPSSSLPGKEETCLTNCVDRFIDTTMLITNR